MNARKWFVGGAFLIVIFAFPLTDARAAQARKPLTNDDVVNMTKQGLDQAIIVKSIQTNDAQFDVSPQALIDLKAAGISQSVMDAMMTAESNQQAAQTAGLHGVAAAVDGVAVDPTKPICNASGCLLREGTEVTLKFAKEISSKTANDGDSVEFILADDVKVGDDVVVKKDCHATATVSNAKKAGMMGKPGELNVQLQYLDAGSSHIRLRGTKGREGESKTGTAVALTVIFGPIGLIKHGKNVDIPEGTPLTAYIDQDVWLPPIS